jgi:hypothetical protein
MKPYKHARISVKKWGGQPDDYLFIHDWFDHTKAHIADMRHRVLLHNSWGIYLCEQVFGTYFENSDGKIVQVRDVAEQHVLDDLGTIPSLDKCLKGLKLETWMGGPIRKRKIIKASDLAKLNVD